MKTLAVIFSFVIFFTATPVRAQSMTATDKTPLIYQTILNNIQVPENMKGEVNSERVRVVFTIDPNGHAHVMDINTNRLDIKRSVTEQFEALDFAFAGDNGGQTYSIWLNFKVM
jgi:hypothetical protein